MTRQRLSPAAASTVAQQEFLYIVGEPRVGPHRDCRPDLRPTPNHVTPGFGQIGRWRGITDSAGGAGITLWGCITAALDDQTDHITCREAFR